MFVRLCGESVNISNANAGMGRNLNYFTKPTKCMRVRSTEQIVSHCYSTMGRMAVCLLIDDVRS
ncbi:hypothetical protein EAF04_004557 [Stromatinia cepivora]|nr:hypothetical protein EAF04_004557 [Stromatinia cepivora]